MEFLPKPKEVKLLTGEHALCYDGRIVLEGRLLGNGDTYAKVLQQGIQKKTGMQYEMGYGVPGRKETGAIVLGLDETLKSQQYVLQVTEENITIQGGDGAGVLYGVQTLCQMIHEYGALLPAVRIEDEPDLPVRGYYLDETRGRVLTLSYLKQVADRMAYYKLNQLQLYVEHTYLFSGLSEMWRDETPLTAEEIRELDAYCAKLHIELVPSIATFGHLYMLLSTKSYGDLCEFPDSWKEPFSFWNRMQHHTVDVSGGRAIELIKAMIEEYMALFATDKFNICADETFDLGKGASRALAEEKGTTVIYTEFVTELANYITESGRTPMFWSDVISQEPEVYHLLPKNLICLHWDYAANVSSERLTRLANSGAEHLYVCPGVQGWNQLINKYHEAYENISRMARYGHECHAMGLLNTDWGDYGHINHPDFSRIGMIYGAAFSWNADILPEEEINRQISVLEFGDASGKLVSVLDLLCHQDAYPWRTAVMVQEALELHQDKEEAAELLRSCAEGDADASNASIDALCAVLYEKAGTVRPENRPMIYAYLLAADGLKVLNRLLPFLRASLLSEGTLPEKEDCFALAGDLERWLHSYKELWRTVSKESELYRIAHVFCWYADLLRDLNA